MLPVKLLLLATTVQAATTIFNGRQSLIFPFETPQACLDSFNTTLDCDTSFPLLFQQTNLVGWNATNLTALCTDKCRSSLTSLKQKVVSSCNTLSFNVGSSPFNAERVIDFYQYKYNLTCLSSGSSWCLLDQRKWFTDQQPKVTWPQNTNKTYPDWNYDPVNGTNARDENGTIILPYNTVPYPVPTFNSGVKQALDYRYHGPGPAVGKLKPNVTVGIGLEYDEYPLEIQCSTCFLQRFKLGFMSRWGETFDDVKSQAWENIKKNCNLKDSLFIHPALDHRGPPPPDEEFEWDNQNKCDRSIAFESATPVNCSTLSAMYNVATSSLRDLNKGLTANCAGVQNGTYCLPAACQVAKQWYDGGIEPMQLIQPGGPYENISFTQFVRWNAGAIHYRVFPGDYICIGPPGGAYVAGLVSGSTGGKPVYTTTAKPAMETPPGTIANCGAYYDTISGDYCQMIAMNFSITFDQLRWMNPQLDADCLNLWANASYCVATVRGTTLTPIPLPSTSVKVPSTSSKAPSSSSIKPPSSSSIQSPPSTSAKPPSTSIKPSSTSPKPSSAAVSTKPVTVAPPAQTQSGASKACYQWYTAVSGDYCYLVYTKFSITFDQLRTWNPSLDENCSNMWPDYAYCVKA